MESTSDIEQVQPRPRLRLTEARNERDLSQQQVADMIGTTHVNISRWERGITKPNPYFRRKLSQVFGKTEEALDLVSTLASATTEEKPAGPPATLPARNGRTAASTPLPVPATPASVEPAAIYDPIIPLQPAIPLVGRERDLGRIKRRLYNGGNVALTALNGLPGVGKTALSTALAHDPEVRTHFSDGILWAGLGPNPNIAGLLSRWGSLLGIAATEMASLKDSGAWARALRTAIGSRKMLLVIDDAWKIEEALTFKVGGPNCAHMLTTRYRDVASHIAFDGATEIQELSEEESMALLRLLAPAVVEREGKRTLDLIRAVGGLPLALTLMGNYLRKQAYSGQPRRIATALQRLSSATERLQISEPHGPVESHPSLTSETQVSLQSVIAVTDQVLPQDARHALYALSVFPPKPNSFSEDAALAVIDGGIEALDLLLDAGLLESNSSGRYVLHQTISDYARLQLQGTTAQECLISYVIEFVEAHKKDYEQLELETNVILAALDIAYELGIQHKLVRAVIAFTPYMLLRGFYSLADKHLQRAYDVAVALEDQCGTANALLYRGEIARNQGDFPQAGTYLKTSLDLARHIGDQELISAVLEKLGWVSLRRSEYAQAEEYLHEGLAFAHQIGHSERISSLLMALSAVAQDKGNYTQSIEYAQEGLIVAHQIEDREQICALLISLGAAIVQQGNYKVAERYFKEALVLARQIRHRYRISTLLLNLAFVSIMSIDYVQAINYLQEGLMLARQLEQRTLISATLSNLGQVTRKVGNYAQADVYLQESLTIARQSNSLYRICDALCEYGDLQLDMNHIEAAEATFLEVCSIVSERDHEALAQYGLARVMVAKGNLLEAIKWGEMSTKTLESMGHYAAKEARAWLGSIKS